MPGEEWSRSTSFKPGDIGSVAGRSYLIPLFRELVVEYQEASSISIMEGVGDLVPFYRLVVWEVDLVHGVETIVDVFEVDAEKFKAKMDRFFTLRGKQEMKSKEKS